MEVLPVTAPALVLVEDNADDERLSLRAIKRTGIPCHITVLRDGAGALEHLVGRPDPPPNVIVLDYRLPNLSGREILAGIRAHEATRLTPVVIFSGTNAGVELVDCYRGGANSCVVKPVDPSEYVERLAAVAAYWLGINEGCDGRSRCYARG